MYGCESWTIEKAEHPRIDVMEKTLESALDSKEIKPINPKENQSWIFTGRTDAKAEAPVLWPCDVKYWLIGRVLDAGKDWKWEEKGTTEDEMVGWHHRLDGHEFEWAPEVVDGQGRLACCSPWGYKDSDTTEWLNWTVTYLPFFLPFSLYLLFFLNHWKVKFSALWQIYSKIIQYVCL